MNNWRYPTKLLGWYECKKMLALECDAYQDLTIGTRDFLKPQFVPNFGWVFGTYQAGTATGAVSSWYVHQHNTTVERRTARINPLIFMGQTDKPVSDNAIGNKAFALSGGEFDAPALRGVSAADYLKRYIEHTGAGDVAITGSIHLSTHQTTIDAESKTAIRIKRGVYTAQLYTPSDTKTKFEVLASTSGARRFSAAAAVNATAYQGLLSEVLDDKRYMSLNWLMTDRQGYCLRKIDAARKHIQKMWAYSDLMGGDLSILDMCEREIVEAENVQAEWQAFLNAHNNFIVD